jgi:uncharacterized protein (DUF1786 family)
MQVLAVDVGTGTQDVYLFRSGLGLENGYKLVMPSPTMLVRRRILAATARGEDLLLTGVTMGGGPSAWGAEAHLRAGRKLYATPDAARSFNDDLDWVQREMGVAVVSDEEARRLSGVARIVLRDFDYDAIAAAFDSFGVDLAPVAVAVAVFDHGAAPPDISDRKFRFDYLLDRLGEARRLSGFAFLSESVPPSMTRMRAVAESAAGLGCPLVVMDTAPAAILGATLDRRVGERERCLVANVGNFHTLAFRLGPSGVEGLFEHHTGLIDTRKLDGLLGGLAAGTLTREAVFNDQGHGALLFEDRPLPLDEGDFGVAVTGPRRAMLSASRLRPYFAVPHGDMMIVGCLGLLAATADLLPPLAEPIRQALSGADAGTPPWEAED